MKYTIRVELHKATWDHYALLYKAMAARGMGDVLTADDGTKWKMPPGEYTYDGTLTLDQVLAAAKAAAGTVGLKFAILVTKSDGRKWEGLEQVR